MLGDWVLKWALFRLSLYLFTLQTSLLYWSRPRSGAVDCNAAPLRPGGAQVKGVVQVENLKHCPRKVLAFRNWGHKNQPARHPPAVHQPRWRPAPAGRSSSSFLILCNGFVLKQLQDRKTEQTHFCNNQVPMSCIGFYYDQVYLWHTSQCLLQSCADRGLAITGRE